MVIATKQGVKLLITRGCVRLLKIKVSLVSGGSTIGSCAGDAGPPPHHSFSLIVVFWNLSWCTSSER